MKKRKFILATISVLVLSLSACGSKDTPASSDEDKRTESSTQTNSEVNTAASNTENFKRCIIIMLDIAEENPSEGDVSDTINKIQQRIDYKIQQELDNHRIKSSVSKDGSDKLKIEIFLESAEGEEDIVKNVLDDISIQGALEYKDADNNVIITDADIEKAEVKSYEDATGNLKYMINLVLNKEGKKRFADGTERVAARPNVSDRYVSVVFDGNEIMRPRCNQRIESDSVALEDIASAEEATKVAKIIEIGSLPLKLNIMTYETVDIDVK